MVHPYMRQSNHVGDSPDDGSETVAKRVIAMLDRLHVIVVGPGLGRDEMMQETAKKAIAAAREKGIGIVVDAVNPSTACERLAKALGGVTVIQKGKQDYISNGEKTAACDVEGGLKRSGGQGDTLTGCLGTFLAWKKGYMDRLWELSGPFLIPLK
ncbi:hypothetical protein ABW20_dc0107491 [Dactylellina cionopaga]|nr:hypothetical protein ABW20_dc0107491 [Dactylellina cionopaga]